MTSSKRSEAIIKIFNTYLSKTAYNPLNFGKRAESDAGKYALEAIQAAMETPLSGLFDEIGCLVLKVMEDIYDGVYQDEKRNENSIFLGFKNSAAYQAMQNDLGTKTVD